MSKKNIIIISIYTFLNNFLLYRACDVLYYLSKGITNNEYINYLTVGSIITVIFLVPFGILKDKYNRKYILILSNLFLLISTLFYICADNVYLMGVGILVSAISNLLSQGIVISLLHYYISDKNEYSKVYYKWTISYYTGYLVSMILGGMVAKYSLVSMYYLSLIPIFLNFIVLFMLDDKEEKEKEKNKTTYLLKESYNLLKKSKLLKVILLLEIIIMPLAEILAESHPEYLANIGASTVLIGIYTAIMCLFGIVGNKIASIQKNKIRGFFIFTVLFSISLILIGVLNNYFAILFIVLFQCFYSITDNTCNTTVQNECSDSYRQTILAIFTFIISIVKIIVCTITSFVFSKTSLGTSYIILGICGVICTLLIILTNYKVLKK